MCWRIVLFGTKPKYNKNKNKNKISFKKLIQDGPIYSLALNKDCSQVVIGGRNVFKLLQIEDGKFREIYNLRSLKQLHLNFSCNDVAWSLHDDHYVATAATNGHVSVWNLSKVGRAMQEQDYQDHKRTVHKVNFHATDPFKLISGSQDGTMRYFDIRVKNAVAIFDSQTDSVRDVKFSPHHPYTFCAVHESGNVQLWDIRKPEKFQYQFTAHSGPIFGCDWHPECTWLATASRDKTIKVWDLSSNKATLEYTIHTIASNAFVKWRPQYKYQIASCALVIDCSINIWDVRRPYIPFAAFNEHRDMTSCVAWTGDPNLFLSSGRDTKLIHHTFADAQKPASKANPQGISANSKGEVICCKKLTNPNNISSSINNSCSQNSLSKAVGLMRKISNSQAVDNFHQISSRTYNFNPNNVEQQESSIFLKLAESYLLHGRSVSELCERNSAIAQEFGKSDVAVTWKVIKTMYGEEFIQNSMPSSNNNNKEETDESITSDTNDEQKSNQAGCDETPSAAQFSDETENEDQIDNAFPNYLNIRNGCLPKGDFFFGENELDVEFDGEPVFFDYYQFGLRLDPVTPEQIDYSLPTEAFPIRHEILDRTLPPEQFPDTLNYPEDSHHHHSTIHQLQIDDQLPGTLTNISPCKLPCWDPSSIVINTLHHYAALGDIQTVACILIVLGDSRKYLTGLNEILQEHWMLAYIEFLSKYKLWNISNEIIKLSWLGNVSMLNHQGPSIRTNCGKCFKSLQRVGWMCDRCHTREYGLCSICQQVVKGLYVWCQGCAHGGHVAHIKQWLAVRRTCPTGCGHKCEIN